MNKQFTLFDLPKHEKNEADNQKTLGKPRLNVPVRNQVEMISASIDDYIPIDHPARNIWTYVEQMDLSAILNKIQATSCSPGRTAIDPRILLAIWVYAIAEGIGSARVIERYCSEHLAFKWICGGVSVNYHTISDFRRNNSKELEDLITLTIARLIERNLVTLQRVSQDGVKVRAAAGTSSFRRKPRLKELLAEVKEQVRVLNEELDKDPAACLNRQLIAKKRASEDRLNRIQEAIKEHQKSLISKGKAKKKERKPFTDEEKKEIRASTTDPESRKMKMANGGFNPAYNMQLAVDTNTRYIVRGYAIGKGNDFGELAVMNKEIIKLYNKAPGQHLVDQGYLDHDSIIETQKNGTKVYVNPSKVGNKDPFTRRENEPEMIGEWRERMGTEEAKEVYKDRASTSELANAGMRNRGLKQLLVRGIENVQSVLNLHVITHNILRAMRLRHAW
jgi:transposase